MMKGREDFYCYLAEEMYFYKGFDPVPLTRSTAKAMRPASPAVALTPQGKRTREVAPLEFEGHCPVKYLPKPAKVKTRAAAKKLLPEMFKYGNSGNGFKFRRCFVCCRIGKKKYDTVHYCSSCQVGVYRDVIRYDKQNEQFSCWNELHSNPKFRHELDKRAGVI